MPDTPGKTIYDLALHETIPVRKGLIVTRTPRGWLYENDKGHMVEVDYDPSLKFAARESVKRDALRQLDDFEEGYGL